MSKPRIVHLLDDTTTGGVTRVVTHICNSQRLANQAHHEIRIIPKNAADMPVIDGMLQDELAVHTPEGDGMRIEESPSSVAELSTVSRMRPSVGAARLV